MPERMSDKQIREIMGKIGDAYAQRWDIDSEMNTRDRVLILLAECWQALEEIEKLESKTDCPAEDKIIMAVTIARRVKERK